jgi:hypothetical protein
MRVERWWAGRRAADWSDRSIESTGAGVHGSRAKGPYVLAYLFGPKREAVPTLSQVSGLDPSSAVKVARVGDLHLIDGTWPIIGHSRDFRRSTWPFPKFVRSDEIGRRAWVVEYAEDDPGRAIAEVPIAFGTSSLDRDAAFGAGALELVLTKVLGGS